MKQGWEIKKLGDVIEIRNGKNQQAVLSETGKYKIMGSAGNVMGYSTDFICEAGTTIIGRKGNISKPIYIDERFWNVDTAFGFFPKNENEIDKRLIYYLCLGIDFGSMNRGTTIPSLVKSELKTIQISYPKSLPEQQRIVAILDEAFAALAKAKAHAEQNLKNAKELFESYLQGVFENKGEGWEEKNLGEIASFSQGIQVGLEKHLAEQKLGYVRFIRIVDYTQNTDDIRYVPDPGEKYYVKEDDIVMVRYGTPGLIGRGKSGVIANNLFKITIETNELSKDFLCLYLSQKHIQTYLSTQGSATMPALNFGQLKTVSISYPSIKAQQTIVQKLDSLSAETKKLEAIYQQKIKDLEELKKSVLQKAFSGELKMEKI